jgi:hypothetical protein
MANGEPHKMKVARTIERLRSAKFVVLPRNKKPEITKEGKKELGLEPGSPRKDFG